MEAVGAGCWGRICATLIAKLLNYLLHSLKLHWVCFSGKVLSMVLKYAACKTRSHDGKSVRWTDRWVYLHFKSTLLQILWKISLLYFFFFPGCASFTTTNSSFLLLFAFHWTHVGRPGGCHLTAPWFDPDLPLLSVWSVACSPHIRLGVLWVLWFPNDSQKHACRRIGYAKLPIGLNEWLCVPMEIPSKVYSNLMANVPGLDFGSTPWPG